jgi:hypothetical protein
LLVDAPCCPEKSAHPIPSHHITAQAATHAHALQTRTASLVDYYLIQQIPSQPPSKLKVQRRELFTTVIVKEPASRQSNLAWNPFAQFTSKAAQQLLICRTPVSPFEVNQSINQSINQLH